MKSIEQDWMDNLSWRARRALQVAGYESRIALVLIASADLIAIKGAGAKTLRELNIWRQPRTDEERLQLAAAQRHASETGADRARSNLRNPISRAISQVDCVREPIERSPHLSGPIDRDLRALQAVEFRVTETVPPPMLMPEANVTADYTESVNSEQTEQNSQND